LLLLLLLLLLAVAGSSLPSMNVMYLATPGYIYIYIWPGKCCKSSACIVDGASWHLLERRYYGTAGANDAVCADL